MDSIISVTQVIMRKRRISRQEYFEIWALLSQTRDVLAKARDGELRDIDISWIHGAVLFVIKHAAGPVTPAEMSRWLLREPHSVSRLLVNMEKRGLIRRVKDLERKNMIRLVLTEKGMDACHVAEEGSDTMETIMASLSKRQRANFRSALMTLRDRGFEILNLEPRPPHPLFSPVMTEHLYPKQKKSKG